MVCPYAVHRKVVLQVTKEYDEEGYETSLQQIENNMAQFVECQQENCGAWQDDKCNYRG